MENIIVIYYLLNIGGEREPIKRRIKACQYLLGRKIIVLIIFNRYNFATFICKLIFWH